MSLVHTPEVQEFQEIAKILVAQHQAQEFAKDKTIKNIKPLNAFIAFRTYHQGLFPGVEQKQRSGYITFLWKRETGQARWSILAKAFTIIRDIATLIEADKPKLKEFLALNAPFVGLPEPPKNTTPEDAEQYLAAITKCVVTILVEDVVANSLAGGFLKGFEPVPSAKEPVVVMAALPPKESAHAPELYCPKVDVNMINQDIAASQETQLDTTGISPIETFRVIVPNIESSGNVTSSVITGSAGNNDSFQDWCEEYFEHINNMHMEQLADSLIYHGTKDDTKEFAEGAKVQTDFDPYAGDAWTAYDISAPIEDLWESLLEV